MPDESENGAKTTYVYLISLVAAVGGFMFGYDLVIIGGAMLFMKKVFGLNAFQEGFAMGSVELGCIVGALLAVALADRLGRRKTLALAALLFAVSAVGTALPRNITEFNTFRILTGVAVGLSSVVSPLYIAEVAPARIRGQLVTVNQLAIVVGSFAGIMVAYALSGAGVRAEWRWMFASELPPVLPFAIGLALVPESPRWLVTQGLGAKAMDTLVRISGRARAAVEFRAIEESVRGEEGSVTDLFRRGTRVALLVAIGLAFFQQMTGASILFNYAPSVFAKAGFVQESDAIGQSAILQVWNVAITVVSMLVVDRIGRRPLLLLGTAGMVVGLFLMGLIFQLNLSGQYVLVVMFLAIGAYILSLAPLAWLVMSEIFPNRIRGKAMSVGALTVWVSCYAGVQIYAPMRDWFQDHCGSIAGAFWVYAAVSLAAFVFCWRLVPETKGRTLEDIARHWGKAGASR